MIKISFLASKRWPMAVAAGLCTIGFVSGCTPQEAAGPGSAAVDSAVASALKEEGEVQFATLGDLEQDVQANLMAAVVNELGGKAKVLQGNATETMAAAAKGQPVAGMAFWKWQQPELWDKYVNEKAIVEVGKAKYPGEEGWYVPTYVIKGDEKRGIKPACPELPNWEALNKCVATFATAKTGSKGQFMSGAESWAFAYGDPQRIENLKLNYEIVFAGSEAALYADLTRAYEQGKPWLGLMWRPNYMTQKYDLTRVEFPPNTKECWGKTYACQWPETVIYKWASSSIEKNHPTLMKILKNYDLNNDQLQQMQEQVINDGKSPQEAVKNWMQQNRDVWTKWP
ncbi:glycine betaine ABC transporter substrate-binding protein [uncultured Arthrobacter sp.]|uniref:glycine betaine ABC transporter substrate-binding protein n=1 Tax=uncultured Arthrobacter sp. TaxID=114050 RepID=UPI0028D2749B|nr:glycine betaine ABC transporter substrate-binding protein [uncultured Arthrobacter sp.]